MAAFTLRPSWIAALVLLAAPAFASDVSVRLDGGAGFSLRNSAGAIERLRVDEATGNVSRNGFLFVHSTGSTPFHNLFVGPFAGNLSNTGYGSMAFGNGALAANTTGNLNSAFGYTALRSNTSGGSNSGFGFHALHDNTTGVDNSAFGSSALYFNTVGDRNSAFGTFALFSNTTGSSNSAFGLYALVGNQTGFNNSAFGGSALRSSNASSNSAFGFYALAFNTSGGNNAAFGNSALSNNTTGSANVAMGIYAGQNQTTGSANIYLANQGVAGENGQIKIGSVGTHTGTTIAGISGATSSGGVAVLVNASGKLGTSTSSARFKQDVRDMGDAGGLLMKLRPVTFRYREEAVGADEAKTTQYGLIAEEVAEVVPELVAPDLDGRPYSVKYHALPALLLGQNQQQQRTIDAQREAIAQLSARVALLEAERREPAR